MIYRIKKPHAFNKIIAWLSTSESTIATSPTITAGSGAPSASEPNGSIYLRTDGTANTTIYVRAGGSWVANGAEATA